MTGLQFPSPRLDWTDYAADRVVVQDFASEGLRVFNVSDGRLVLHCDESAYEACLTPDGRNLVQFEDETTLIWRLDGAPSAPQTTTLFHAPAIDDYSPSGAAHVSAPQGQGAFHFVVGHFGFAVDYAVDYDTAGQLALVAAPRIIYDHIIYDPVLLHPGHRYPFVELDHGFGGGLKVLDVAAGTTFECPEMPGGPQRSYGRYRQAIPHRRRPEMLVDTRTGWGLWKFGATAMTPFCSHDIEPLHFEGDSVWVIRADDPGTLLRYAVTAET